MWWRGREFRHDWVELILCLGVCVCSSLVALQAPDIAVSKQRIQDVLRVLADFASLREEGRSRAEYLQQFKRDCCAVYGYNQFLLDVFCDMFSPPEVRTEWQSAVR